jgi:hypothetical protein
MEFQTLMEKLTGDTSWKKIVHFQNSLYLPVPNLIHLGFIDWISEQREVNDAQDRHGFLAKAGALRTL